jgi:hypothetical protein
MARPTRWLFLICAGLLGLAFLLSPAPSTAQDAATAALLDLQTATYPRITAFLDAHDAEGNFIHGLQPGEVRILENENILPVDELTELSPGVQFVIAVTAGSSFTIRDGLGVSRYEYLVRGLSQWSWEAVQTGQDDFSLVISAGPEILHRTDPRGLLAALQSYQPAENDTIPNLQILARAIQVAAEPTPRPGMERAVLLITAPQFTDVTIGLQNLAGQAQQQGIRIYVWLVAAADYFSLPGADQLRQPTQTGGRFFAFSGVESVPDLEDYLEPLRYIYSLTYTSQVKTSGTHQVSVEITANDLALSSPPQSFEITFQPPSLSFITPPTLIERTIPLAEQADQEATTLDLVPRQQALAIQVDFPDGYERPLVSSVLYVDGVVVAENLAPPFDRFAWDLQALAEDGSHTLQAEIVDSLGMSGQSPEISVQITVPRPSQGLFASFARQRTLVVGLIVLLSGSVLILVLILGGRIRPRVFGQGPARNAGLATRPGAPNLRQPAHRTRREQQRQRSDPVTQPVEIPPEISSQASIPARRQRPAAPVPSESVPASRPGWFQRLTRSTQRWAQRRPPVKTLAYLAPMTEAGEVTLPAPIPLTTEEAVLGSDPLQVSLTLDDPSIDPIHARLYLENNAFWLQDHGSVAGTWINFSRIGPEAVALQHGDLVHIGRIGFRFVMRDPGRLPKPVVIPLERKR